MSNLLGKAVRSIATGDYVYDHDIDSSIASPTPQSDTSRELDKMLTLTVKRMLRQPGLTVEQAVSEARDALARLIAAEKVRELERLQRAPDYGKNDSSRFYDYVNSRIAELRQLPKEEQ